VREDGSKREGSGGRGEEWPNVCTCE
jgi:hypothetical protein